MAEAVATVNTASTFDIGSIIWRIKLAPTIIKDNYEFKRFWKNPNYYDELHEKEAAKAAKKEARKATKEAKAESINLQKEANKAAKETKTNEVGPETKEVINNTSVDSTDHLIKESKAKAGQNLINYAIYVMSHVTDEVNDPRKSIEEKEIINGIAAIFNYGKIFKEATIADLSKYDPSNENYLSTSNYIIIKADVERRLGDEVLAEDIKKIREATGAPEIKPTENYTSWKLGDDGMYRPIFIHPENEAMPIIDLPVQGDLSDEMFNKLESVVNQMIIQSKHRYEQLPNGLINLYITRNSGLEVPYVLDPGVVLGKDEVSILAKTQNDTIFIPILKFLDIATAVANNEFYMLQPAEVAKITQSYALYPNCYTYIDMSKTDWLNEWSYDEQTALKAKVASIVNIMYQEFANNEKPRFRFNQHVNSNDFILISDPDVKSPLSDTGETSGFILPGYMYQVTGNVVTRIHGAMDQVQYNI